MFIARQPIFNRRMEVFGYELLFRSDLTSTKFDGISSVSATATVIGGLFECGIDSIVENKYAFINFDDEFIHSETVELIEPDRLIIEILENVKINKRLVDRIRRLKIKGYKIALDDFVEDYTEYPLVPIADIIKFDIMATPLHTIEKEVNLALSQNKTILAEKIETKLEFQEAKRMGFHLFQGYFFSRPNITSRTFTKTTTEVQYYRVIHELSAEEPSFQKLAEIIETDVTLSYRIMRMVSFRSKNEPIQSIKKALTYMGLKEIQRWINILILQDLGKSKPKELMRISLIRSRFAEEITINIGLAELKDQASMMGLFSVMDAMLDQPLSEALKGMALSKSITDAMLHHKGVLYPVYSMMLSYEKGDWENVSQILKAIMIDPKILHEKYVESLKWANEIMKSIL